jgi:hypothetical protein
MALGSVGEDSDSEEVIPNRPLAVGEDGPRRYRELIPAAGAFPQLAGREGVNLETPALRAVGLAVVIGPQRALEQAGIIFLDEGQNRDGGLGVRLIKPSSQP